MGEMNQAYNGSLVLVKLPVEDVLIARYFLTEGSLPMLMTF